MSQKCFVTNAVALFFFINVVRYLIDEDCQERHMNLSELHATFAME
jgi:UPF0716 family protein affecting phage T7 exclusion